MNDRADLEHSSQQFSLLSRDPWMIDQIKRSLSPLSYQLQVYADEMDLLRIIRHDRCQLVVFDARCTTPSHNPILTWQRCHGERLVPLIVIGDFLSADTIFAWYQAGALDVLCVPFNTNELHVRAAKAIKPEEPAANDDAQICVGPYRLDRDHGMVYYHHEAIRLTTHEFSIAWLLFSNPNVCFRRAQLAQAIWGRQTEFTDRTMEQHIYKLRKKLHLSLHEGPVRIRTLYSHGYKLETALRALAQTPEHAKPDASSTKPRTTVAMVPNAIDDSHSPLPNPLTSLVNG